jgi:hypothetical protein
MAKGRRHFSPLIWEALAVLGADNEFEIPGPHTSWHVDTVRFSREKSFDEYWSTP